jgi:imidazolonepropionase-like amidohydrolase
MAKRQLSVDPTLIAMHTKFWGDDARYTQNPLNRLAPELLAKGWLKGRFTSGWTKEQYLESQGQWGKLQALTKKMFDAGVLLTVGTDTPTPWIVPGPSYHEELQLLQEVGIPNQDVLKMATLNGARALKLENEIGSIKAGMKADLVVLRANPLEDIKNARHIELVMKSGTMYVPQELLK